MAAIQAPVVEPIEEVAYKNRPPLLEDVSVEGPFRTPIAHALDTIEQRDLIEEDYNWWRYSHWALPNLIIILLLLAVVFVMTAFEQVGDIRGLRDGIPQYYQLQTVSDSDDEAGLPVVVRNLRAAYVFFIFVPVVIAFAVLFGKPRPKLRKILLLLCALLIFVGAVLAIIAFAIGEDDARQTPRRCPELQNLTNEPCISREGVAQAALATDFLVGIFGITTVVALVVWSKDFFLKRVGWRQQERDLEQLHKDGRVASIAVKAHKTRQTRIIIVSIALIWLALLAIAAAAFTIVLHQDHDTVRLFSFRGRTDISGDRFSMEPFEEAGWSARNTRLRYAFSAIGILAVLANFIPWRSTVVAYIFAVVYFIVMVGLIVAFALDVSELRNANERGRCPSSNIIGQTAGIVGTRVNCINSPYVALVIMEIFAAVAILFYLVNEYCVRYKSIHSQRKYPWHSIRRIETEQDSRRPVRDELTSKVMTAKEYYYRHRFLAGPASSGGTSIPSEVTGATPYTSAYGTSAY